MHIKDPLHAKNYIKEMKKLRKNLSPAHKYVKI
jgi:hypothetical protein